MIRSLLVTNRGEIACRITRTVAVYSDAGALNMAIEEASQFRVFRV